ncbi:MAG: hypothetical protein R2849_21525 [Thermomicrobiales bacterium]
MPSTFQLSGLPPGHYAVIVRAIFDGGRQPGDTEQGFNLIIAEEMWRYRVILFCYGVATAKGPNMVVTKQDLHRLIDEIPEEEHQAAAKYLTRVRDFADDPVYQAFMNAPIDDEPLTDEDLAAIEEAEAEIARGETYSLEDIQRDIDERRGNT